MFRNVSQGTLLLFSLSHDWEPRDFQPFFFVYFLSLGSRENREAVTVGGYSPRLSRPTSMEEGRTCALPMPSTEALQPLCRFRAREQLDPWWADIHSVRKVVALVR